MIKIDIAGHTWENDLTQYYNLILSYLFTAIKNKLAFTYLYIYTTTYDYYCCWLLLAYLFCLALLLPPSFSLVHCPALLPPAAELEPPAPLLLALPALPLFG
jgi:hypothetical protein